MKTVLHYFVESDVVISNLKTLIDCVNAYKLGGIQCTLPILQNVNGDTALDIALRDGHADINMANMLLMGIKDYPFMHSGF